MVKNVKNVILVIDVDVRESTQVMLMNEGHTVEIARDGIQGVHAYGKIKPKITFLDIKMPGIDGYETFDKIKQLDSKAKVAFITGFKTDIKRHQDAEKNDLVDTIQKPVELTDLLKIINKYN